MLVKITGAAIQGIDAIPITIETLIEPGFQFVMVGLPDTAVKESSERVASAIQESGFEFPRKKIVINMLRPMSGRRVRPTTARSPSAYWLPMANWTRQRSTIS